MWDVPRLLPLVRPGRIPPYLGEHGEHKERMTTTVLKEKREKTPLLHFTLKVAVVSVPLSASLSTANATHNTVDIHPASSTKNINVIVVALSITFAPSPPAVPGNTPGAGGSVHTVRLTGEGKKDRAKKTSLPVTPLLTARGVSSTVVTPSLTNLSTKVSGLISETAIEHLRDHPKHTVTGGLTTAILTVVSNSACGEGVVKELTIGSTTGMTINTASDLTTTPVSDTGAGGVVTVIATGNAVLAAHHVPHSTKGNLTSLRNFKKPLPGDGTPKNATFTGTFVVTNNPSTSPLNTPSNNHTKDHGEVVAVVSGTVTKANTSTVPA